MELQKRLNEIAMQAFTAWAKRQAGKHAYNRHAARQSGSRNYDNNYLDRVAQAARKLTSDETEVLIFDVFNHNRPDHAEDWANKHGKSVRTYYNNLSKAKTALSDAMLSMSIEFDFDNH